MLTTLITGLAVLAAVQDGERVRIRAAETPKEIIDLVKKHQPQGVVAEAEKRVRDDRIEYRLRIVLPDRIAEADFDVRPDRAPSGTIEDRPWAADVPLPVAEGLRKAVPEADLAAVRHTIRVDEDHPEGRASYRWSLREPKRRVEISPDGATVRISQRIAEAELPQAVRDALQRDHAGLQIRNVDRVAVSDAVVFEFDVRGGDDLTATLDGKIAVRPD